MPRLPATLMASLAALSAATGCVLLDPLAELSQDLEKDAGGDRETPEVSPTRPRPQPPPPGDDADASLGGRGAQVGSEGDAGTGKAGAPTEPNGPAQGGAATDGGLAGGAGTAGAGGTGGGAGGESDGGGAAGAEQGLGGASQMDPETASPVAQLAAGAGLTCVVRTNQELACWGRNDVAQATPPPGAYSAVAIGADGMAACGILADGSLVCWGEAGFADVPEGEFVDVAMASEGACAIDVDGALACWGSLGFGLSPIPTGKFLDVSMRAEHACAVRDDHTLTCWGQDGRVAEPPEGSFESVETGDQHHCAVSSDGPLVCWGTNDAGESTPPTEAFVASASRGTGLDGPVSCGVTATGDLTCWGTEAERIVDREDGDFKQLALTSTHLCAVTAAGELQCWTKADAGNEYGQASPPWTNVRQLAVGSTTMSIVNRVYPSICAVFEDDRVDCIGDAQLAAGVPFERVREIAIGSGYACATGTDGALGCWGLTESINLPSATDLLSIRMGYGSHGCALNAGQTVDCWGFASSIEGEFIDLDYSGDLFVGVRAEGPLAFWADDVFSGDMLPEFPFGTYRSVSAGPASTCALDEAGIATCIRNHYEDPIPVTPDGEWLTLDIQEGSSCGLRSDRAIDCWQGNRDHALPTEPFKEFTERLEFGCGLRADNSVACWGELSR